MIDRMTRMIKRMAYWDNKKMFGIYIIKTKTDVPK